MATSQNIELAGNWKEHGQEGVGGNWAKESAVGGEMAPDLASDMCGGDEFVGSLF
jgi:hypothetical protein